MILRRILGVPSVVSHNVVRRCPDCSSLDNNGAMNLKRLRMGLAGRLSTLLRGKEGAARAAGVSIGRGCRILSDIATTEPWLVSIGDRVTISTNVQIVTHDGSGWLIRDEGGRRFRFAPVKIGSNVFVGAGVIILPGVSIGDNCVIGAGSVVAKSVTSGSIVVGNPARLVDSWDNFSSKVSGWHSASDMKGGTYRERVESVTDESFRPPIRR